MDKETTNKELKIKNLPYSDLKKVFKIVNEYEFETIDAHIVFSQDSFSKQYSETERTYAVSSNNKAYQPGMIGYSIYGDCLDGVDLAVRLDRYMKDEKGGKDGWKIERCYISESTYDIIAPFFVNQTDIDDDFSFYLDDKNECFRAVYYNPNSNAGGQFVEHRYDYQNILEASTFSEGDTEKFFQYLVDHFAPCALYDASTIDYYDFNVRHKHIEPFIVGEHEEVKSLLLQTAKTKLGLDVKRELLWDGSKTKYVVREIDWGEPCFARVFDTLPEANKFAKKKCNNIPPAHRKNERISVGIVKNSPEYFVDFFENCPSGECFYKNTNEPNYIYASKFDTSPLAFDVEKILYHRYILTSFISPYELHDVDFKFLDCKDKVLNDLNMSNSDLSGSDFRNARISNCYVTGTNFEGASFNNAYLENIDFAGCNLTESDFRNAHLVDCDFSNAIITDATFDGAKIESTTRGLSNKMQM